MKRVLAARLGHVLVGANSGRFERLARELFVFVRDEVAAERELVNRGAFSAEVKDLDLS